MKKNLMAVILVVVMLFSCVATVGAAPMSLTGYLALCEDLNRDINVLVDIEGKLPGGTYGNSVSGMVGDGAVFRAVLDMTKVKDVVEKIITGDHGTFELSSEDVSKLKAMPVTGSFTITAKWTGVDAPADITAGNMLGFTFDGGTTSIFEETTSRNLATSKKSVTTTISVKSGVTVNDLTSLPNEIILEIDGFKIVTNGKMEGEIVGSTTIGVGETGYSHNVDISYAFTDPIAPVNINVLPTPNGGGSGSGSGSYSITYETNGGTALESDSYSKGSIINLNKVPEKEGYIFDGWYLDAALTKKITSVEMDGNVTVYAAWKVDKGEDDEPVVVHPVPEMLDGGDHFAYLSGYTDGTIRPESNVTRAEVATIFFRLLKEDIRKANLATENVFDDVNAGDWFNTAISTMAKLGVVNGRSANTFAPDEYITRAEFTTICARFDNLDSTSENKFTDIGGHWAEKYIIEAVAYNWINGYEDNTFRPEKNITRAEAATLINRVLNRVPENAEALLDTMKVWPDNSAADWYYVAIQEATNSHTYELVNELNEKWLELAENRDWTVYEK